MYYIWEFYDTIYDDKDIYEFDKLNELKKKIILTHKEYKDIGNNVQISAGTVVMQDVLDNSLVIGNPCIIKKKQM